MIKRCFRPFWSYDVIETEKWLADMARQGWRLQGIHMISWIFKFIKVEPQLLKYRIQYSKLIDGSLPSGLAQAGWEIVKHNHHWCIYVSSSAMQSSAATPGRGSILSRNFVVQVAAAIYLFLFLLVYQVVIAIGPLVFLLYFVPIEAMSEFINDFPFIKALWDPALWIIIGILCAFTGAFLFLSIFALFETVYAGRQIRSEKFSTFSIKNYGNLTDVKSFAILKKRGLLESRTRFFWTNAPDKTEEWLQDLAAQGLNLYRISGHIIYFIKSQPTRRRYCIDYQPDVTKEYFDIHLQQGWTLIYTPVSMIRSRYTIWTKLYQEAENKLELYNDKDVYLLHLKDAATRLSVPYFVVASIILLSQLLSLGFFAYSSLHSLLPFSDSLFAGAGIIFTILLSCYACMMCLLLPGYYIYMALQPICYYRRMRKKFSFVSDIESLIS